MWRVSSEEFGSKHHRYADALLDYGFFLLNIDSICQAVKVYQMALDIRVAVFGGNNLHVAVAHEDLAYCAYVHEYSSGKFHDARYVDDAGLSSDGQKLLSNSLTNFFS